MTRLELSVQPVLLTWLFCGLLLVPALQAADLPRVPEGFTVELVADHTLAQHPMMGCFDDRGRLFIAESAGTNRRSPELLEDPQDKILMLEDLDGDGVFDQSTVFADKMVFPQGCLWYQGALYTCSSPYLWKLEDTDDDGVCDERTVLVKSFGFSGNAADIHGPFLSPDGRLYWCDGRHGHEIRDLGDGEFGGEDTALETPSDPEPGLPNPDGSLLTSGKAARIFSCKPDGSDVQVLCGGGMDNPVEVDFWETGECIGTVNLFYGRPRGDCLVHWVRGGVYPRFDQQACIDEFPWTGGLLGPVHNYGHVAVSGMTRYRSDQFFPESVVDASSDRDTEAPADLGTFFVTEFNTHKLVKTVLQRDGASFRHISTEDFLVSDDPDFHPTDVIEDADGSLLLIDTGGWFRIGCPTSQIAKPEIAGAIYRIRREGAHGTRNPHGEQIVWGDVDDRTLFESLDAPQAAARLVAAMTIDTDSMDSRLKADTRERLGEMVTADTEAISRAAAENLARCQTLDRGESATIVRYLMDGVRRTGSDRELGHSLVSGLIDFGDHNTELYLADDDPRVRRAALIALDQMDGGNLTQQQVIPLLDTSNAELQETVLAVISRREGWAADTVDLLREWISASELSDQRATILRSFLAAQAGDGVIQELIADSLQDAGIADDTRVVLLEIAGRAAVEEFPDAWIGMLQTTFADESLDIRIQTVRAIRGHDRAEFDDELLATVEDSTADANLRIEAFAAIVRRLDTTPDGACIDLVLMLAGDTDVVDKLRIARALSEAPLSGRQLGMLADSLEQIGSTPTPVLLAAFERGESEDIGRRLVTGLESQGKSLRVSAPELARILSHYPQPVQAQATGLLARLGVDLEEQASRLEGMMPLTESGDPNVGHYLFFGEKAACGRCHRIGDQGAQIGPDLSKIASIRQPRDLLEALAFPSASFARGYRPYTILSVDGRVENGLIVSETSEHVILQTTDLRELQYERDEIDAIAESTTSIMPQGLETRLSQDELRDLLAYLQSLK